MGGSFCHMCMNVCVFEWVNVTVNHFKKTEDLKGTI